MLTVGRLEVRDSVHTVRSVHNGENAEENCGADRTQPRDSDAATDAGTDDANPVEAEIRTQRTLPDENLQVDSGVGTAQCGYGKHDFRDEPTEDERVKVICAKCDKFYGYG